VGSEEWAVDSEQWAVKSSADGILLPGGVTSSLLAWVQMRRGFSIYLILFFGLGPLSALLKGSEDAYLPPCCRRHGAHHCAMYRQIMAMRAHQALDPRPAFCAAKTCPLYPGPRLGILAPAHALAAEETGMRADFACRFAAGLTRTIACSRPSLAHAGRGPPETNPS